MKKEISKVEVEKHNRYGTIFSILFLIAIVAFVPLVKFLELFGVIIWGILYAIVMVWAVRVWKIQKDNDISTYKEIVAFSEGKMLDEIQKQREIGKRPYQTVLKLLFGAAFGGIVIVGMFFLFDMIF